VKIKIINPNTSMEMTESIHRVARLYAAPDTELVVRSPASGPLSIDCLYDEALALAGVLAEIKSGESDGFDGFVIACFNDPALFAAREISSQPVVGIGEASLFSACYLGYRFSILSNLDSEEAAMWELVKRYGLESRCASIRPAGVEVMECEADPNNVETALVRAGRLAVDEDRAEVLCLGCAGMAGMDRALEQALAVPVIDPVAAGLKAVEGLVACGKKTSKILSFRTPRQR
jgi:allantoin racemase